MPMMKDSPGPAIRQLRPIISELRLLCDDGANHLRRELIRQDDRGVWTDMYNVCEEALPSAGGRGMYVCMYVCTYMV